MDTRRQTAPELGAYRTLVGALRELVQAERSLTIIEEAGPDPERARHLSVLRAAIADLTTVVPPER